VLDASRRVNVTNTTQVTAAGLLILDGGTLSVAAATVIRRRSSRRLISTFAILSDPVGR